jgi:hypothetical protein
VGANDNSGATNGGGIMQGFKTWESFLAYLARPGSNILFYKAPMDILGTPVRITKVFKNGKVRVQLLHGKGGFTADSGHLDRFFWRIA